MSKNSRSIGVFPYERKHAEQIVELGRNVIAAQMKLGAFINTIRRADDSNLPFDLDFLDHADFSMRVDDLLTRTFPELMPVDWGFDETSTGDVK